ncbi:MAG: fumarate reductase subunit C [Betaproteobacteria bacterium]|nr:fumarate reductase subunit C [Betaproteobacteria bacterium]
MSARRPFVRPMDAWWLRDAFFVRYMLREATALFVVAYALVLLAGVICLAGGPAAYAAWLRALATPWSIALHVLLLLVFLYHTWSWFRIMPKTMSLILPNGRRLSPALITGAGLLAATVLCIGLFMAVRP